MTTVPRKWLVEKLVWKQHLNVEEREMLGSKSVKLSEVKDVVREHLKSEQFFPPVEISKPGQKFGYEGYIIEKVKNNSFKLHCQINGPLGDFREDKIVGEFNSIDAVLEAFFKNTSNIDGIEIEKD